MDRHPESVSVEISDCSEEDARIVFDTLCAYFASDRCAEDVPERLDETRPTVWLGTFDVTDTRGSRTPAQLSGTVTADVQGGYWAVDRLRTTLGSLFSVRDLTGASGDQERDVHLRLTSL